MGGTKQIQNLETEPVRVDRAILRFYPNDKFYRLTLDDKVAMFILEHGLELDKKEGLKYNFANGPTTMTQIREAFITSYKSHEIEAADDCLHDRMITHEGDPRIYLPSPLERVLKGDKTWYVHTLRISKQYQRKVFEQYVDTHDLARMPLTGINLETFGKYEKALQACKARSVNAKVSLRS